MAYYKSDTRAIAKAFAEGRGKEVWDELAKLKAFVSKKGAEHMRAQREAKRLANYAAVKALEVGALVKYTGQTAYTKDASGKWVPTIKEGAIGTVKSKARRTRIGVDFGPYGYYAWLIDRVAPAPSDAVPTTERAESNPMETVILDVFSNPTTN